MAGCLRLPAASVAPTRVDLLRNPQRWFPLSPPTQKAEDPLLGGEGGGDGGGDVGRWATATEQRRAADFAHYNPVIQVRVSRPMGLSVQRVGLATDIISMNVSVFFCFFCLFVLFLFVVSQCYFSRHLPIGGNSVGTPVLLYAV